MQRTIVQRLTDGAGRYILAGGQATLLVIGAQIGSYRAWFWIACAIALLSLFGWLAALHRRREVANTPTSQIASAAQGYVELIGRGKALEGLPLLSPGNAPCLWYRYTVEQRGRGSDGWRQVSSETSTSYFILDDGTGECVVDPEGAEVLSIRKESWISGNERHTQWLLLPNDSIYALGQFKTRSSVDERTWGNEAVKALLDEWKKDRPQFLKRFDLNNDGEISISEWELARAAARREIDRRRRETAPAADWHLMTYPGGGRPFLLTNMPPEKFARRYLWFTLGHLAAFFAALAGAAYVYRVAF
ncbi:MAG: E3 ubiquitin ligase family protein [Azonexus sp.]|jgi:hypothetical protein|nr:E3 ubiquitin ligase family protein [Azonexus sp.]